MSMAGHGGRGSASCVLVKPLTPMLLLDRLDCRMRVVWRDFNGKGTGKVRYRVEVVEARKKGTAHSSWRAEAANDALGRAMCPELRVAERAVIKDAR